MHAVLQSSVARRRFFASYPRISGKASFRMADYPPSESDTDNTCLIESGNPL